MIKMETDNRFNLPRNTLEKILFTIIILLLTLIIIFSSTVILQNMYTQNITDDDVIFSYTIYGNEIKTKVNPLTDIKNLNFKIIFESSNNRYSKKYLIEKCNAAENLEKTFYIDKISKETGNETPYLVHFIIEKGFKKPNSTYQTPTKNKLKFSFEYQYAAIDFPNSKENIFTTKITNTTNKSIVSIQHFITTLHFENNIKCELFEDRYDFETPLKPGETRSISIKYDVIKFYANDETKENLFSSPKTAKSYSEIEYDIVYGNKVIKN